MLVMRKYLLSLLLVVFSFLILPVTQVSAKVITDNVGTVSVAKTEIVNDDLFIAAESVNIAGTVNGDVFIGAQSVKVTGTINGNLHVAASAVELTGLVKGNVYAVGGSVLINGAKVGGSVLSAGGTVNMDGDTVVTGSVLAASGTLTLSSQVKRSVYAGAGTLTLGETAKIGKDFYYAAGNSQGEVNISPKAVILGNTYKQIVDTSQKQASMAAARKEIPGVMNAAKVFATVLSFVGVLIVGFLYFKFFDSHFVGTVRILTESFWKSFGVGFLVSISFIPALIILLVTVVGIPVAGIAILMLILYSYLAKIVVGSALGNKLSQKMKWNMSIYPAFAFGVFLIFLLKLVPVVGGLTGLVVFWSGLGALTLRMVKSS